MPTTPDCIASTRRLAARRKRAECRRKGSAATGVPSSYLIGAWSGLTVPRLMKIPREHSLALDWGAVLTLAETFVTLNLGGAAIWNRANSDPIAFIRSCLRSWIAEHGGAMIRRRFALNVTLSSSLILAEQSEEFNGRLYFMIDPNSAGYVVLGPTLDLLAEVDRRLPATFLKLFSSLEKWIRVYDYRDAERVAEIYREWTAEEENPEEYEFADVARCIPAAVKEDSLDREALTQLFDRDLTSPVRELVRLVLELDSRSRRATRPVLTDEERREFADANAPLPALLAVFAENDAVEACFDEEGQTALESLPEPNLVIPMDSRKSTCVRTAFRTLGVACDVLATAVKLIDVMPGNSKWVST
jgi:hypothetical protein